MTLPTHPRLRRVDSFPMNQPGGELAFALRDPEGFATPIALPYPAAALASLMDGSRTFDELQAAFAKQFGYQVPLADLEGLVRQLDERSFLDSEKFRRQWKAQIERYLNSPVRPAAHAGAAYASDPEDLRRQ